MNKSGKRNNTSHRRFKRGEKVAEISVGVMIILTVVKGLAGLFYGSVALIADAVNSFSDIFASALVWSGLRLAGWSPNEKFPYGYYRAETIASLLVSILIVVTGVEIIWEAGTKLFAPTPVSDAYVTSAAALSSMLLYYVLSVYKKRVGMEIGSNGLVTDAMHSKLDVYSGGIVFVGILFSASGYPVIEISVALIIGIYILKEGFDLAREALLPLMDACMTPQELEKITEIIEKIPGVIDVHDVKLRAAGPVCFAEMHVTVSSDMHVDRAHDLTEIAEDELTRTFPEIESVTIHVEPGKRTMMRIAIPIENEESRTSVVNSCLQSSPFFCIVIVRSEEIEDVKIIENSAFLLHESKGQSIVNDFVRQHVDVILTKNVESTLFDLFRSQLIPVYKLPSQLMTAEEAVTLFLKGSLSRVTD